MTRLYCYNWFAFSWRVMLPMLNDDALSFTTSSSNHSQRAWFGIQAGEEDGPCAKEEKGLHCFHFHLGAVLPSDTDNTSDPVMILGAATIPTSKWPHDLRTQNRIKNRIKARLKFKSELKTKLKLFFNLVSYRIKNFYFGLIPD